MVLAKDVPLASTPKPQKPQTESLDESSEELSIEQIAKQLGTSLPPTDLYSDEPELESDLHLRQIFILIASLEWLWRDRTDFFASGNLTVYFSQKQTKTRDFRGPDFLVVLDTERRSRKSWTIWEEEGKYPNVIVEVLSDSTAKVDRTTKKALYQNTFRLPEYFWFDPVSLEFAGFILVGGQYEPIEANESGQLWSRQLGLFLGLHDNQLRYFTAEGELVLSPTEAAQIAERTATEARQSATEAQQKAQRLAERLRELGIDPETV